MARKSKSDIRKPEILEHFYQVMCEEGFEGASIAKIAEHMGVHPSLLIHYFKTKDEMIVDLVDFILKKYEDTFLATLQAINDPHKRFDLFFTTLFGLEWERLVNYRVYLGCLYLSTSNERIRERFRKMFERFREVLIEEIIFYRKHGIIEANDPAKMADIIIALVEGLDFFYAFRSDPEYYVELGSYLKSIVFSLLKGETEVNT